jgi:uncharacterized membrane protein
MARRRLLHAVGGSLWLVPLLCLIAGIALSFATIASDAATGHDLVPRSVTGGPTDAQTVLSTIATAMVTLSSIVLTVTLVAVQLAMGQFSPRIVRALLRDRRNQLAVGLFVATFAFALLGVRGIDDRADVVPGVTVAVAYLLALVSIVALVLFVHHAGQSLRVSGLIDLVGDETRAQLDRAYPVAEGRRTPRLAPDLIPAPAPGVIVGLDRDGLVAAAARAGCTLELLPAAGDYVPTGAPLLRVHGDGHGFDRRAVAALVALGPERTHEHEPAYGLRKLVDIAERAVYQSFEDPTTAVMAIHRLHDCLRLLAPRPFPSGRHCDAAGAVRLVEPVLSWAGYVRLAFDELRLAGAGSPQVARRLRAALEDLKAVAPPERHAPLDRQLRLLEAAVHRSYQDEEDVHAALVGDSQGIGSGVDVERGDEDGAPAPGQARAPAPRSTRS